MIIKKEIPVLDKKIYQVYSDKNVYIKNKTNGTLWKKVNSSIDFEYEETDILIEEEENDDKTR